MEFDELQTFIDEENARLKKSGKVLCATITNSYDYMVVMVKRSMNLAKTVVAAAASFRVAEAKEDCEFPTPTENMDLFRESSKMEQTLNFQVPAEGLELVILLHTQY